MAMLRTICAGTLALTLPLMAARNLENLDRGVVAVYTGGTNVYLGWRLLGTESRTLGFNIYRNGVKINATPITESTNYVDNAGSSTASYVVKTVVDGVETKSSAAVVPWGEITKRIPLSVPAGGTSSDGVAYTYSPNDGSAGDLDGNGTWDLVLKWDPSNSKDNSQSGYTGNTYLDGMTLDGKKLWRIDLGVNIRAGAHYSPFVVADFDQDGKAEIMVKTAPGTKDGTGAYLSKGPAASDDDSKDYRNTSGYILSGPEYLTVFRGTDGKELATVAYNPERGTVSSWGDSYGNRVDRFLATAAWLDGTKPSAVMQRGYYTRMAVTAYDWNGTTLSQRWTHNSATSGSGCYGQGNHNLTVGDVDGDGKDEIIQGSCAIDDNGSLLYRTGLGHGDAMHLGDLDPTHAGLEVFEVHEETGAAYGYEMHDARTGAILWGAKTGTDNGRGIAADIDASTAGYEAWSFGNASIFTATGVNTGVGRGSLNFRIYWNADLQDELLDAIGSTPSPMKIDSWKNGGRLVSTDTRYGNYIGHTNNSTKSNPVLVADLFGDWREEMILRQSDNSALILYTTTLPTTYRIYTLMHDPIYRAAISWQNAGYNQPPHLGFWLGGGPDTWPTPSITLTGATAEPSLVNSGTSLVSQTVLAGEAIDNIAFTWANCTGVTVTGLPNGVTSSISGSTVTLSGAPLLAGSYNYKITTTGGTGTAFSIGGTITAISVANVATAPDQFQSLINAAYPYDGVGMYEDKNAGWIDSGYYNFVNSSASYGKWKFYSPSDAQNVKVGIFFANGGTAARHMNLVLNGVSQGAVPFAKTNAWTTWDTVTVSLPIVAGENNIELWSIGSDGGPNVDEFAFDMAGIVSVASALPVPGDTTGDGDASSGDTTGIGDTTGAGDPTRSIVDNNLGGPYYNFASNAFISPRAGTVQIDILDLQGRVLFSSSQSVSAGATRLAMPGHKKTDLHLVQIRFEGKSVLLRPLADFP